MLPKAPQTQMTTLFRLTDAVEANRQETSK